jgi:hypothetical protein
MLADTLVLDPRIVPRKLFMRTTSAVRLTISFRLCQPFFEGSKEQQQRAKKAKGDRVGLPCFFGQLGKG